MEEFGQLPEEIAQVVEAIPEKFFHRPENLPAAFDSRAAVVALAPFDGQVLGFVPEFLPEISTCR
jgi:hypothetical protein